MPKLKFFQIEEETSENWLDLDQFEDGSLNHINLDDVEPVRKTLNVKPQGKRSTSARLGAEVGSDGRRRS